MPRRPRFDAPGLLHHVMSRGIARRTVFETRRDMRFFLSLLAREVRAGRIEVLAFALLPTHFHLLVRSRTGELDRVMQRVLNLYVRYFNRTRRRDGPLFRSRYRAKPVRSRRYLECLIPYIDQNPVSARLADRPAQYPYGSAHLYVRARRPPWLSAGFVDGALSVLRPQDRPAAYAQRFGRALDPDEIRVLQLRMEHASEREDDWDDLVGAAPDRVLSWMQSKARLADGTKPGLPYVGVARILEALEAARERHSEVRCRPNGNRRVQAWPVLRVGLLRDLGGLGFAEISHHAACSPNMASRRVQQHARLLAEDASYAALAAEIAAGCLLPR